MEPENGPLSALAVLGFGAATEAVYRAVLRLSPTTAEDVAATTGRTRDEVGQEVSRLVATGLLDVHGDTVVAAPPERALLRVIDDETSRLRGVQDQLESLRGMIPTLAAEHMIAQEPHGETVGLQVVPFSEVVEVVKSLTARSTGDLLWVRPDQWRTPEGRKVDELVQALLRAGRRSRVLYPARALEEAPDAVRRRAELGEQVRVLAELPMRMAVLGDVALAPHRLDIDDGRFMVVRQPALAAALRGLFEELWQRALAVPGLEAAEAAETADDEARRRLLVEQLARGAKDEQIARALGLSLRTVRRRVAAVLDELGASSRFQAGVEAVRRGWV